ncbi:MAG: hypothetical protein HY821_14480 [Acidobacteria bacterium]|nr:hypothetical protein [Acidobacteriota bacterium]
MSRHAAAIGVLALAVWSGSCLAQDTLLVVHKLDNSLGFYDAVKGELLAAVPTGAKPHEFALSMDQKFAFVTNYGADTYTETQPGGNTISVIDLRRRQNAGEIALAEYRRPHGIERG